MIRSLLEMTPTGLDQVVWQSGWRKTPKALRVAQEMEIRNQPEWVVDGVSFTIQQKADLVVFLDYPRWQSYLRCARRNMKYLFKSRPGLPESCPEILILPTLVRIIWNFPSKVRPRLLELASTSVTGQRFVHVRSDAELEQVMESFRADL